MVRAAVLHEQGRPLSVEEVTVPDPGPGQVRVRLAAAGVCHSDLSLARGALRAALPAVLGHEGAGRVESVGAGVTSVAVGDPVMLCWAPPCRSCWFCSVGDTHLCERSGDWGAEPRLALADGTPAYAGLSTGAFAELALVPASAAIAIPEAVPLEAAALLGCAVLTGVGAVLNTAKVRAGESVLVIGLGGVGLSAVQGARLAGAAPVIAVDPAAEKADIARRAGATEVLQPGPDLAKRVRALTGGRGVDHAFECVGRPATIRQAWSLTRRGGHTTIVGVGRKDDEVTWNALELFHFARTIVGCVYGSMDPDRDVPVLVEAVLAGRLDLDAMITKRIGLADVDAAFAEMESGQGARSLVVF